MKRTMLFALSAMAAGAAFAQGEAKKDPAKPDAAAPPLKYESAFKGFRPYEEQEVASWRDVNDEVARVGGHVGVLKSSPATEKAGDKQGDFGQGMQPGHQGAHGGMK